MLPHQKKSTLTFPSFPHLRPRHLARQRCAPAPAGSHSSLGSTHSCGTAPPGAGLRQLARHAFLSARLGGPRQLACCSMAALWEPRWQQRGWRPEGGCRAAAREGGTGRCRPQRRLLLPSMPWMLMLARGAASAAAAAAENIKSKKMATPAVVPPTEAAAPAVPAGASMDECLVLRGGTAHLHTTTVRELQPSAEDWRCGAAPFSPVLLCSLPQLPAPPLPPPRPPRPTRRCMSVTWTATLPRPSCSRSSRRFDGPAGGQAVGQAVGRRARLTAGGWWGWAAPVLPVAPWRQALVVVALVRSSVCAGRVWRLRHH